MVANNEAINLLRQAGVPDEQLLPVQGGERIPLFTRSHLDKARSDSSFAAPGIPGAPKRPKHDLAAFSVDVWPSLHCFMPEDHPEVVDTGTIYKGSANPYSCTLDITMGMKHGLLRIDELIPADRLTPGHRSFIEYVRDRKRNVFSHSDGGQLMFNFKMDDGKSILWSAHLGGYEAILRELQPKPSIAILAIAGRANLNGRPFEGSAAEFAAKKVEWLGRPSKVVWCLHDEACIPPWRIETASATRAVEENGTTKVLQLEHGKPVSLEL